MDEGKFEQALDNWLYIKKNMESADPFVMLQIGKCHEQLDSEEQACKFYKQSIKIQVESKELMENKLFLESLFALAQVEMKREEYKSAYDAYESFISFISKNSIKIQDETTDYVKQNMEQCQKMIDERIRGAKSDGVKNIPYASSGTNAKRSKTSKEKPYQKLRNVDKDEQKQEVEKMWREMENSKMDIEEDSKWYIISMEWFKQWKAWSGFRLASKGSDSESTKFQLEEGETATDKSVDEPGRIDSIDILNTNEIMLFGESNLKDNLVEEQDFVIVNPDIWRYLFSIYDGNPILRTAIKNADSKSGDDSECIIEVNQAKLYIFEVPRENKQDYYEVMLASRNWTMTEIKYRICNKKKIKESDIRLWKIEKPADLDKFYCELEYEWKKYKSLRIDGQLIKDLTILVKDSNFSRDDFLMIEYPIPTSNENGYALVEVERKDLHESLNEKAAKALREDESLKEALTNPKTLEFTKISINLVINEDSVLGGCGLSNLGNTCFMNSALQCMSNTIELSKYFLFNIHDSEINHTNVLGSKGRVAEAYGDLMKEMWIGDKRKTAPFNVKKSIGTVVAQFRGYNQQDSHEFLHYLIDTLNEDLNRIKEKPYVEIPDSNGREDSIVSKEQWDAFTKRNNSVLIDLFYGQLKSRLICLECENISNTFDPYSILSIPVPVVKIVKLKETFIPHDLSKHKGIMNIEANINDNLCVTELEKMIQTEVGSEAELLFYIYDSNKVGKRIKKNSFVCRELVGMNIGAFSYELDKSKPSTNLYILDVHMKRQAKKMLFFSGEDAVCLPFVLIVDSKSTCRDIKLQIFKFLYPIINLPKSIKDKVASIDSLDEQIEAAFVVAFEDSSFGDEELYELQLLNNRESSEGCPSCRKPHKGPCKFDFSQKSYKAFLNHCHNDPELCILWKINTTTDLSCFERPEKRVIGDEAVKSKSKRLDLDCCMDSFRQEEIFDGDNKWYCGKCKEHVKARK